MTTTDKLRALEIQHAKNMRRPRFWYEPRWMQSDTRVCVLASTLRKQLRKEAA